MATNTKYMFTLSLTLSRFLGLANPAKQIRSFCEPGIILIYSPSNCENLGVFELVGLDQEHLLDVREITFEFWQDLRQIVSDNFAVLRILGLASNHEHVLDLCNRGANVGQGFFVSAFSNHDLLSSSRSLSRLFSGGHSGADFS